MNRRTLLSATAVLPFAGQAFAQTEFPLRPISMVVAFPPGGQADLAARPTAAALERGSEHPLAAAVVAEAAVRSIAVETAIDFDAPTGKGVIGTVDGRRVAIGNAG